MGLPYWVETMLSLSAPAGSKNPGRLVSHVAAEYIFPIVPPGANPSFVTTPSIVYGSSVYMVIPFKIYFGYMVPGAFELIIAAGGINNYRGTISGYQLENGIDGLFFHEPDVQVVYYINNLTAMNQYYQHTNHYLIVTSEKNYNELKSQLEKLQFPYEMPTPVEGA